MLNFTVFRWVARACITCAGVAIATTAALSNPSSKIDIELNTLKPDKSACQVVLVIKNGFASALDVLSLELVLFDREKVMDRMLRVKTNQVPAGATRVQVFKVDNLECGSLGSILVNDVSGCAIEGSSSSCATALVVSHRTSVPFSR